MLLEEEVQVLGGKKRRFPRLLDGYPTKQHTKLLSCPNFWILTEAAVTGNNRMEVAQRNLCGRGLSKTRVTWALAHKDHRPTEKRPGFVFLVMQLRG